MISSWEFGAVMNIRRLLILGGALALTTTLTRYEIDISGRTYDSGVIGAFAWTFDTHGSPAPMEFYLDTIRWEK